MVIEIPDKLVVSHFSEQEIRLEIAVALFAKGLLLLASAASLAGISNSEFQTLLHTRGINTKTTYESPETLPDQVSERDSLLTQLTVPTKKGFDFEEILRQQRYAGPDRASLQESIRALDIQDSLNEMLATLQP